MKKKRIIPVLLLRNGQLVQSKLFKRYQNLGNPSLAVRRLSQWAADEIIYLDISRDDQYDLGREDLGCENRRDLSGILADVAHESFMPVTLGGGVKTLDDFYHRLQVGADKVAINTAAFRTPKLIEEASREFGSQCVVLSVDATCVNGIQRVAICGGREVTDTPVMDWLLEAEARGAGEILLNVIERDGVKSGYDLDLLAETSRRVKIPLIALGGAGTWEHLAEALRVTNVDAVAAANLFHHSDQSVFTARQYLHRHGLPVRPPYLLNIEETA